MVWSRPRRAFSPGCQIVPRCLKIMLPGMTYWSAEQQKRRTGQLGGARRAVTVTSWSLLHHSRVVVGLEGRLHLNWLQHTTTPLGTELLRDRLLVRYPIRSLGFDTGVSPAVHNAILAPICRLHRYRLDGGTYRYGKGRQNWPVAAGDDSSHRRPLQLRESHRIVVCRATSVWRRIAAGRGS